MLGHIGRPMWDMWDVILITLRIADQGVSEYKKQWHKEKLAKLSGFPFTWANNERSPKHIQAMTQWEIHCSTTNQRYEKKNASKTTSKKTWSHYHQSNDCLCTSITLYAQIYLYEKKMTLLVCSVLYTLIKYAFW